MTQEGNDYLRHWSDHPDNPLIMPPRPEILLGDPTVVLPQDAPDGRWHLFANTMLGIHHFTSGNGTRWIRCGKVGPGWRAWVLKDEGRFYMFSEQFTVPQVRSHIELRWSDDLWEWTEAVRLVEPSLAWEGRFARNTGNPCVLKVGDRYRMYFSAGIVFLGDLGFCEPRYIGVAHADSVTGPYVKDEAPIISPADSDPYRNRGAGAMKVIFDEGRGLFYGFNNGIYTDPEGRTRSAILLMSSADGLAWEQVYPEPILSPGGDGWKKALVYQLDVKRVGDEMWMYYNARSGWRFAVERIGLSTCPL
jgi:hypothetical protein